MDRELSGKRAVVTGASRGIGLAIASELAREGVRCLLVARSADRLTEAIGEIKDATGRAAVCYAADLRTREGCAATVTEAVRDLGGIDILINNAGATSGGSLTRLDDEAWADGFSLKLTGAMRLCRAAWPHLKESRGAIVNVVGITARVPKGSLFLGGAVNAGLLNLTKSLAELGSKDGVRVNAISPGHILTDRLQARLDAICRERSISMEEATREMLKAVGATRFGLPGEIASVVAFLASDRASYVHGAELTVDGGSTRVM